MLRGYRKNDYEAVVEGYVIETGLKFIITVDYNKFKEIFQKRRRGENRPKKEETTNAGKETTSNSPTQSEEAVSFTDSLFVDDKRIPVAVKDSTDGN
jgi:hypothetical protein